ncbi:MAG: hypothetical protein M3P49_15350 [Actinomycetota bacterium]|nr:hypothetical protein [Actinomycetota bacterium]
MKNPAVREVLGPNGSERAGRFLTAYNSSKHHFAVVDAARDGIPDEGEGGSPRDEHLFSVGDAVVGYVVCRRLARPLYAHAGLRSPRSLWSPFAGRGTFPPVPET